MNHNAVKVGDEQKHRTHQVMTRQEHGECPREARGFGKEINLSESLVPCLLDKRDSLIHDENLILSNPLGEDEPSHDIWRPLHISVHINLPGSVFTTEITCELHSITMLVTFLSSPQLPDILKHRMTGPLVHWHAQVSGTVSFSACVFIYICPNK